MTYPRCGILLVTAIAFFLAGPAASQAPRGGAARKDAECFNPKETEAEAEVRTGIRIREILRRCVEIDPGAQAYLADWYAFDAENAARFQAAVEQRRKALDRIYSKSSLNHQNQTDATVATEKPQQVNSAVCKSTYDMVDRIKKEKWPGFKYYARLQQNLLPNDIPVCRQ